MRTNVKTIHTSNIYVIDFDTKQSIKGKVIVTFFLLFIGVCQGTYTSSHLYRYITDT